MEKEEFKIFYNQIVGRFAFHLSDTHGIPKQIFDERYIDKDGYFKNLEIIFELNRHRDFWKQEKKDAQEIRKCP